MNNKRNTKGFTLTEVMVSMFILAIVIAGFLPIFTLSISNIYNAGRRTEDVFTTQKILEEAFSNKNTNTTSSTLTIIFTDPNIDNINVEGLNLSGTSINMFLPHH